MRLATAATVALALGTAVPAASAERARYAGAGCSEAVAALPVPAERVRDELAPGWAPSLDGGGLALLGVGILRCSHLVVGGQEVGPGAVSDVGVLIDSPDGSDGAHFYQLWQHTDVGRLHALAAASGLPGQHVPISLQTTDLAPLATAFNGSADVPGGAYRVSGDAGPLADSGDSSTTWWHVGRHGTIRIAYSLGGTRTAAGPVTFAAAPGSPLHALTGSASSSAAGLLIELRDFEAQLTRP